MLVSVPGKLGVLLLQTLFPPYLWGPGLKGVDHALEVLHVVL